jgi:hypothetical protein
VKPILLKSRPTVESLRALPVVHSKEVPPLGYGGCGVLLYVLFE